MALSNYNPYKQRRVYSLDTGEEYQYPRPFTWIPQPNDLVHTVGNEDLLDQIAYKYYNGKIENSQNYWWVIAKTNQIDNPFDLSTLIGKQIVIPDVLSLDFVRF